MNPVNILMVNLPFAGHTNPTLPLTEKLIEHGHCVTYVNAPAFREKSNAQAQNSSLIRIFLHSQANKRKNTLLFCGMNSINEALCK